MSTIPSRTQRRRRRRTFSPMRLPSASQEGESTPQLSLNLCRMPQLLTFPRFSDTTSSSLTCLFFELATHPEVVQTLQAEIDEYFEQNPGPDHVALSRLKYLQACIDEALRLYPAIPSGVQRVTPSEGLHIGDVYVPGETIVQVPTWTLHRGTSWIWSSFPWRGDLWLTTPQTSGTSWSPMSSSPSAGHQSRSWSRMHLSMRPSPLVSSLQLIKHCPASADFLHRPAQLRWQATCPDGDSLRDKPDLTQV